MATLTLKKKPAAVGKTPGRAPIRGRGIANPRPTIAQAKQEREERQQRYEQATRDPQQQRPQRPATRKPAEAGAGDRPGRPERATRSTERGNAATRRDADPADRPSARRSQDERYPPARPERAPKPGPRGGGTERGRPTEWRDDRSAPVKPVRNSGVSPEGIQRGSRGQDRGPARANRDAFVENPGVARHKPRAHQAAGLTPHEEGDRLSKRMGELGLASRREADDWIAAGWVRVDGKVAVLGQRVGPNVRIDIDPAARTQQAQQVTILLHKPIGYVSGQAEDGYEPASVLVQPQNRWDDDSSQVKYHEGHRRGLAPAGRLDIDSTGLLVLTQDGRVAKLLIGEDSKIEKEYLVRVEHLGSERLSPEGLALLNHGLELDGEPLKPAKVSWANEDQLRFVLREGKKRQIRRMCELVGLKVVGLKRVRIGRINLGHLPAGQWRYLGPWERFD
jgi:23S rRNA pseudouridine2604 synthase